MQDSDLNIERELIKQFRNGNELAFELIFHRTKGKLKGFLNKVLPKSEDEENVLQEIYVKLWLAKNSIKEDKNFETYLYAIARNIVVDILRKRFHKQKYLEELFYILKEKEESNYDTAAYVEYSELEKTIFELIERLPKKRRIIFKFNKIKGYTYKEIAARLNISENTVDSQMRKALIYLRTEMKHFLSLIL